MADVSLIIGTTLQDWAPEIADNLSDRNEFYLHYKRKDKQVGPDGRKGMQIIEGGTEFRESIFSTVNSTFRGYDERETVDTTVGNPIKEAQYPQRIIAGTINISLLEEAQNTEKYQIHELAQVKKDEAEFSMAEQLGAAALSDGTTDTKIPGGLQLIITTTNNVVGTIDSAPNIFWRPQRSTGGVTAWNTANAGLIALESIYEACTRGPEKPDLIVTTTTIKSLINIMNILRLTINTTMEALKGEIGIDESFYRKARVLADDNVPTAQLYLVNTRHLRFKVLRKGNFQMTKVKQPVGGLYSVMQLYVFCNFTCSARRLQGIMTGITG